MKNYQVKEIYYTLQGEGANTGRAAVFCRFAGCNLWTGLEQDRDAAVCRFCDTDFVGVDGPGGGRFASAQELTDAATSHWPTDVSKAGHPLVVCTGGEPLLQLDEPLVDALHKAAIEVAIETNGTRVPPSVIDWICVSPKAGAELVLKAGDELKLVFPQPGGEPDQYEAARFSLVLPAADGRAGARAEYSISDPLLLGSSTMEVEFTNA